jgi:hypothetical protein
VADELIFPEGVSSDALKQLFEEAYMDVSVDTDGDLIVKDSYRCYLRPDPDGRLVSIYAIFGANPAATDQAKMAYVNHVNDQIKLIRASVSASGKFFFDYYVAIEGGVTKRSVVMAVRRFFGCLNQALKEDSENVVA